MVKRKELLLYSVFGILGTIIYFCARFFSKNLTSSVLLPVIIGQSCAVVFSFFANKFFVFKNKGTGFKKSCQQFIEFCTGRLVVFFIDIGIAYFFVGRTSQLWIRILRLNSLNYQNVFFSNPWLMGFIGKPILLNEFIFTAISQVIGVVINYMVSKKIVFKLQNETSKELAY